MEICVTEHVVRTLVVAPRQRIDAFSAPGLRSELDRLFEGGARRFVLDLSAVPFLDSAGIAVMVSLLKRARREGGDVSLVWPAEEAARRMLRLTRFDRVFLVAETADAALSQM